MAIRLNIPFAMDSIHRCSNLVCSVYAWRVCPLADSMRADLFRNLKLNHAQDHRRINYLRERLTLSILYLNRFIKCFVMDVISFIYHLEIYRDCYVYKLFTIFFSIYLQCKCPFSVSICVRM